MEVSGTIDCCGFPHRLVAAGDRLRLPDHEDEKSQVFDALVGTSTCHEVAAAWHRLVHRFDPPRPHRISLDFIGVLMPDYENPEEYDLSLYANRLANDSLQAMIGRNQAQHQHLPHENRRQLESQRQIAQDVGPLLSLPEDLRIVLALTWVDHCMAIGAVPHRKLPIITKASADCWKTFATRGAPSPGARRRLVRALQRSFVPRPKTACPGTPMG